MTEEHGDLTAGDRSSVVGGRKQNRQPAGRPGETGNVLVLERRGHQFAGDAETPITRDTPLLADHEVERGARLRRVHLDPAAVIGSEAGQAEGRREVKV